MSFYKYHLFFCVNRRDDGTPCCGRYDAEGMRDYAKQRIKELGLKGKGGVRINRAGCLGVCGEGPMIVVYPEGIWYSWVDRDDIDEIIESHLQNGRPVERLRIREP
ncbi:MAG TPA: (2Fe-2S) ferredoxin domain-containing protein [Thiotrichales bacterium]|nr:(2Fe-2S) ferredoxin domain-containing protein [Thiotrichales bacterium]